MAKRIVILGGKGNFGAIIMRELAREKDIDVVSASRSSQHKLDIFAPDFSEKLAALNPAAVIHTVGPFQTQDYLVAKAAIACGAHYIDLADARAFVAGIGALDAEAKRHGVLAVSGASSVPCLSAALIDHYRPRFSVLESVDYAIATAHDTNRGLATASAVLTYAGKSFTTLIDGEMKTVYGWQDLHAHEFDGLGRRWLGNSDIPDLELFPARYPGLKTQRFYAGAEVPLAHVGLWGLSWLVRARLVRSLANTGPALMKISRLLDPFGGSDSGFYMTLRGADKAGKPLALTFSLTAKNGEGIIIPCVPAILLARRLARGEINVTGAMPCLGLIDRDSYLAALKSPDIVWREH